PAITMPGIVCGPPEYMSPEQCRGLPIDARSDLYALGVVLYSLLTSKLPFEDESPTQVLLKHLTEPVPDPQKAAPERNISDALVSLTMKALAKKPDERFQNAREF